MRSLIQLLILIIISSYQYWNGILGSLTQIKIKVITWIFGSKYGNHFFKNIASYPNIQGPPYKTFWRYSPTMKLMKKKSFEKEIMSNILLIFHIWKAHSLTESVSRHDPMSLPIRFKSPSFIVILIILGGILSFPFVALMLK